MNVETQKLYEEIWDKGDYRLGSTAQRLVPFLARYIPVGSVINDYGSGTGRADVILHSMGYKINMVDFADNALEPAARALIGNGVTYTVASLDDLPADFPVADWGICINVLMVVEPERLHPIMAEMRRTCRNLIVEVYDFADVRLGEDRTTIKGNAAFWAGELERHWPYVESVRSPEHQRRYITICKTETK